MPLVVLANLADLTTVPQKTASDGEPIYVCVAGQSGAGKSTILHSIAEQVAARRRDVVLLDEKALHHPYLDQLFHDPDRYGFELQVQFMVNRIVFVKRWLAAGYSVVMERSHLEDPVFIRHLLAFGHVTPDEHHVYMDLWQHLNERAPKPDALICLEVPTEVAIQRLSADDPHAPDRPAFPDHTTKRAWLKSWHERYQRRFGELLSDPRYAAKIIHYGGDVDLDDLNNRLARLLPR